MAQEYLHTPVSTFQAPALHATILESDSVVGARFTPNYS